MKLYAKYFGTTLFVLLAFVFTDLAMAQISKSESLSKFVSAGLAYKSGEYSEAIAIYEEVLDGDKESGALYYNLGNSYFKEGKRGKAILNYERALQLMPRDSDLQFNYRHARSSVKGYGEQKPSNILNRLAQAHVQFYAVDEMVVIITIITLALGILYLLSLYLKWPTKLRQNFFIILGVFWLIYTAGFILKFQQDKNMAITLTNAKATFEPRQESTTHFQLSEGIKVKILKKQDNWIKIKRADGKLGWVQEDAVERI